MDENKSTQGQQGQGQPDQGQQKQGQQQGSSQGNQNWNDQPKTNRDPAEGAREETRGTGSQGEKNSSGISNRGMSESDEQADLPSRGSSSGSSSGSSDQSSDSSDSSNQSER